MKKSDKKIEQNIRESLTQVCEIAQENVEGFEWISHKVHYGNVAGSIQITCMFTEFRNAKMAKHDEYLYQLIQQSLSLIDIDIKDIRRHVDFDNGNPYEKSKRSMAWPYWYSSPNILRLQWELSAFKVRPLIFFQHCSQSLQRDWVHQSIKSYTYIARHCLGRYV